MRIRDSVVVVTGASSGIGREVALALARRGAAAVALVARRPDALEEVAVEVRSLGARALPLPCDVADPAAVQRAAAAVARELGAVDVLVNAAGRAVWKAFATISEDEHREMMAVNYWGTFHWIRALLPAMRTRRRGAIVNVIAGTGRFALGVTSGFSASKFAVAGLSESLRRELAGSGVVVSSVFPGSVRTGFWNAADVDRSALPPLVRFAPKMSPAAVARAIVLVLRLGLAERTLPLFVGLLARANSLWVRLGDLLLSPWALPAAIGVLVLRLLLAG